MASNPSDPLYPHYKKARNKLRLVEPRTYVRHSFDALYKVHLGGVEVLKSYQPWNILLALKWMFQEMDDLAHRRRPAQLNDLHDVLNILHNMDGDVPLPSTDGSIMLFMRRMAFQQFWLHAPDGSALARQEVLFAQLPQGHQFHRQFNDTTGIAIGDFLELGFALLSLLLGKKPPRAFKRSIFENIEPNVPTGALDGFLRHLARTPEELHDALNKPEVHDVAVGDQLILPNPLLRSPLLLVDDLYFIYSPPMVYRALETSVYRTLRSIDPGAFMQKFGPIFERYVERCLRDASIPFTTEEQLKKQLPDTGKVVDFVVVEDGCNILIDAKGVEASPLSRVSHEAEIVYRSLKESAMKAVVQGLATAKRLASDTAGPWGRGESYLLVVTFEQLYLGCSSSLAQTFGEQLSATLARKIGETMPFPLDHVFLLDIGEFEGLLERVRAGSTSLLKAVRYAKASDAVRETMKFSFAQHLPGLGPPADRLPFIGEGLDRLQKRCIAHLVQKTPQPVSSTARPGAASLSARSSLSPHSSSRSLIQQKIETNSVP